MNADDTTDLAVDGALSGPLATLRAAMDAQEAPRGVEKELMAAFAAQFPPRRWYRALSPRQWGMAGGAGSTALVAVMALVLSHAPQQAGLTPPSALDDGPAFTALQSQDRIEQEPDAQVIEADVPRSAFSALGLPVNPENAGDSVRAELIVGADGSPLALRLVSLP